MATDVAAYRSFLLRLWQVEQNGNVTWRCSLEEAMADQRHNFASLEAMYTFLQAETNKRWVAQTKEEAS